MMNGWDRNDEDIQRRTVDYINGKREPSDTWGDIAGLALFYLVALALVIESCCR